MNENKAKAFNEQQYSVIVGSLIGRSADLHFHEYNDVGVRIKHSFFNTLYFLYKKDILGEHVIDWSVGIEDDKISKPSMILKRSQDYENLLNTFYKRKRNNNRVFSIPSNIIDYLNEETVAIWYMDRGSIWDNKRNNLISFNCKGLSTSDIMRLKDAFEIKYSIELYVEKKHFYKSLIVASKSSDIIFDMLSLRILPCMYYKLPVGKKKVYLDEDISEFITKNKLTLTNFHKTY